MTTFGFLVNSIVLAIVFGAILCSIAMRNTPNIVDSPVVKVSRNLAIGGWSIIFLAICYKLFVDPESVSAVGRIGVTMLALGTNIKTIYQLWEAGHRPATNIVHLHRRATDIADGLSLRTVSVHPPLEKSQ